MPFPSQTKEEEEEEEEENQQFLLSKMHYYNHHPDSSQRFMDVFPIFASPRATSIVLDSFLSHLSSTYNVPQDIGAIVGPEAEGFLLGPLLAMKLEIPFVPARKKGKLPGDVVREGYQKWAAGDLLEMQVGAFEEVERGKGVVIVDDSVASGGSAGGVKRLVERLGMKVLCACFIFEADMPDHRKTQKKHLGDLPLFAVLKVSEETLSGMKLYDGKKDEKGEYIGDAGE